MMMIRKKWSITKLKYNGTLTMRKRSVKKILYKITIKMILKISDRRGRTTGGRKENRKETVETNKW